jgi:hypothetical protein
MSSNSNASAAAFGWDFQANAAIVLMLDNIKTASSVKVEGQTEDIEVNLSNGRVIYSQAKSFVNPFNDSSNSITKLTESMRTLNNASSHNPEKLIYVTNSPNPFNDKSTIAMFSSKVEVPFSSLPDSCKNKIRKIITDNSFSAINENLLEVHIIPFYGDGDSRYSVIKTTVYEFLNSIGLSRETGLGKKLLEIWQRTFFENCTDRTRTIRKEELVWTIIVSICEIGNDDSFFDSYDEGIIAEVKKNYADVINNSAERFEFATRIISDFSGHSHQGSVLEKRNHFIENNWSNYKTEFQITNISDLILELLVKIILFKILSRRFTIDTIKREVCL